MSKTSRNTLFGILLLLLASVVFFFLKSNTTTTDKPSPVSNTTEQPEASSIVPLPYLQDLSKKLSKTTDPEAITLLLKNLKSQFRQLPPQEAAAAIEAFLESGDDALTGMDLKLSEARDGTLETSSSLRVALLDLLGQIAPQLAGPISETILTSPTHPDEWAIAMRNVAKANPGEREIGLLKEKSIELLSNEDWRNNPTYGFFEAFDTFVFTGHTEAITELATLFEDPERKDLGHAGFLTLDRLAVSHPAAAMRELLEQKELQSNFGPMVANFFARADVRDPEQLQVLAEYLTAEERTEQELSAFAGVYPNGNLIHSLNLMTDTRVRGGSDLIDHDRQALGIISQWLTEPRFQKIRPTLETAHNRLRNFVIQGAKEEPKR